MAMNMQFVKKVVCYFNRYHSTTRATAKHFGISKTTVHTYLTKVMPNETSATILKANLLCAPYWGGKARAKKKSGVTNK